MRKFLFGAFLLGTTAFYPVEAHAMPPVLGFIGGLVTALGATGVGGAIAGLGGAAALGGFAAGYGFAGSLIGGLLIKGALSLGFSYLASLLRPRPQSPNPGAKIVNIRQPISFMEFGYGYVRKGGVVNFWQAQEGRRYYDVIFAAHECDGVDITYCDEREVTLDGSGFVTNPEYDPGGPGGSVPRVRIMTDLGAPGQVAPPLLTSNFPEWTAAHNMDGLCHSVVVAYNTSAEDFSGVYPTGREPVVTHLLRMRKVYDPRTDTTEFSTNAALIMAHWVTSPDGLGKTVNWDQVAIEADVADTIVLDRTGNPFPKWQLGGSYSASEDRESVRAQMAVACDAFFYEDLDGTVGFNVGRYMEPTVEINDDHILSIQYSEGQSGTDVANAFSVQYTEPEMGYREAPTAPYVINDPTEAYSEDSLQVFWIGNHNQGVRVSKRLLRNSRAKYRISATLKYHGIRLVTQRFFLLNHTEMGVNMAFEVDKLTRNDDGITWSVEAHSVTPEDFEFDAITEEPEKPRRTSFETSSDVPEPTGVTAVSQPFAGSVAIYVDFDDPPRDSLLNQIRYRVSSPAGNWFQVSVPPKQSYQRIVGLVDGETYDVQVRALNSVGGASKWVPNSGGDENIPTLSVTVTADTTVPGALNSVVVTGSLGHATVAAIPAHDNTRKLRIWQNGTGVFNASDPHIDYDIAPGVPFSNLAIGDNTRVNIAANPGFTGGLASWTVGTGWSGVSDIARHVAGSASLLRQIPGGFADGDWYRTQFEVTAFTAGSVRSYIGGSSNAFGASRTAVGTYQDRIQVVGGGGGQFGVQANLSTFAGDIDNYIVFRETPTCIPQGTRYIFAAAMNISNVLGPVSGPFPVTVI